MQQRHAALKPLGISRMFAIGDRGIAAYVDATKVSFWIYSKTAEQAALGELPDSPRFHLAFRAPSRAAVDEFYQGAITAPTKGPRESAPTTIPTTIPTTTPPTCATPTATKLR
ncbi:MAG: hypothetical protein ACFCBU_16325 [Cyanophyceae cyanobacterium]